MSEPPHDWPSKFTEPRLSPGFVFWRDFMQWQREINEKLRPLGLTQPQFALLAVYGWLKRQRVGVTQQAAADFLGLERMHVSQISQRLERDGFVERRAHMDDARAKTVALTELGHEMLAKALPLVETHDRDFFAARHMRDAEMAPSASVHHSRDRP